MPEAVHLAGVTVHIITLSSLIQFKHGSIPAAAVQHITMPLRVPRGGAAAVLGPFRGSVLVAACSWTRWRVSSLVLQALHQMQTCSAPGRLDSKRQHKGADAGRGAR